MELHQFNARAQRFMVWGCGIVVLGFLVGMLMAHVLPPPRPSESALETANRFSENPTQVRLGCLILMIATAFYGTWCGVVIMFQRKMEAGRSPVLTYGSLILCGGGTLVVELIPLVWGVAAYRPADIDPTLTRMLNDIVWYLFLFSWPMFSLWCFCLAVCILRDATQILPRWLGYLSIWAGLVLTPASLIGFFKDGLFAYNGLGAFWLPFTGFFGWMVLLSAGMLKAITKEERAIRAREAEGVPAPTESDVALPTVGV